MASFKYRTHKNNALTKCRSFFSTLSFIKLKAEYHSLHLKDRFWNQTKNLHAPKFKTVKNLPFWLYSSIFYKKKFSLTLLFWIKLTLSFSCFELVYWQTGGSWISDIRVAKFYESVSSYLKYVTMMFKWNAVSWDLLLWINFY